jgi:uncharacterized protein YndB with AHSA1/START domain
MTFVSPADRIGAETRTVTTGSRDGVTTKIATAVRTYPTDRDDLWSALTEPQRLARWFMPIEGDVSVGGHYQLVGNAGGTVEQCEPPERFALTWEMQGMVSWVEVTLTPAGGGGTTLELVHEAPFDEGFWTQFGPGAVGVGWDLALMGLGLHLASDATLDPSAAEEWAVSPEGVQFSTGAANGWADAAIADGDDPVAAREAAGRTIAFYTVVPDGGEG